MTEERMKELFNTSGEYLKFDNIPTERRMSNRPDLNAFLLLDKLVPGERDIIGCAEHDEFYLDVSTKALAAIITEEQVIDLVRSGVRWGDYEMLCMFA